MSKKIFIVLLALVVMVGPLFAADTALSSGDATSKLSLDLSFVKRAATIAVGFVGGAYSLWKLASGLVGALKDQDHDQAAIKRVVGTFIFNAILLSGFLFLVNYVGKTDAATATADSFFGGLTGAFISL